MASPTASSSITPCVTMITAAATYTQRCVPRERTDLAGSWMRAYFTSTGVQFHTRYVVSSGVSYGLYGRVLAPCRSSRLGSVTKIEYILRVAVMSIGCVTRRPFSINVIAIFDAERGHEPRHTRGRAVRGRRGSGPRHLSLLDSPQRGVITGQALSTKRDNRSGFQHTNVSCAAAHRKHLLHAHLP